MLSVKIEYEGGKTQEAQGDFIDLSEAARFALDLADTLDRKHSDGIGRPRWVKILRDTHIELSISVLPGGLTGKAG